MTKKTNTLKSFMYLLTFIIGISMNSCSDEDVFNEPEGTITLNMQNENNGKIRKDSALNR